jgi:hypothetical protein
VAIVARLRELVVPPVCVFSFAVSRVGNIRFRERFERALRVVNMHDGVPKVPGVFFNEPAFQEAVLRAVDGLGACGVYTHLGARFFFTGRKKNSVPSDKYEILEISEISGQI